MFWILLFAVNCYAGMLRILPLAQVKLKVDNNNMYSNGKEGFGIII